MATIYGGENAKIYIDTSASSAVSKIPTNGFWVSDLKINSRSNSYDITSFGDTSKSIVASTPTIEFEMKGVFNGPIDQKALWDIASSSTPTYFTSDTFDRHPTPTETNEEEQHQDMQLFEYAVLYIPRDDTGDVIKADSRILIEPKHVLATDQEVVRRTALREFTDSDVDLEFVQVAVRPFGYLS